MFALHNLPAGACEPAQPDDMNAVGTTHRVSIPPMENLTAESLSSDGVFLLENSIDAFIWIGQVPVQ